jgi:hypothetical protein
MTKKEIAEAAAMSIEEIILLASVDYDADMYGLWMRKKDSGLPPKDFLYQSRVAVVEKIRYVFRADGVWTYRIPAGTLALMKSLPFSHSEYF